MKNLLLFLILVPALLQAQTTRFILQNGDTVLATKYQVQRTASYTYNDQLVKYDTLKKSTGTVTPPATGTALFNITWEQSNALTPKSGYGYQPNSIENPVTTGGMKSVIVTDPAGGLNKVVKIGVNTGNKDGSRIRHEMTAWNLTEKLRQKANYSVWIYVPATFKTGQDVMNFLQWHDVSPSTDKQGRIPNLSIGFKGKMLDINIAWQRDPAQVRHEAGDIHQPIDASSWFGRWVFVEIDCYWSPDAAGYFNFYVDKKLLYTYSGPMGYNGDVQGPYFKWGLQYPGGVLPAGSTATSQTLYFGDIIIKNY